MSKVTFGPGVIATDSDTQITCTIDPAYEDALRSEGVAAERARVVAILREEWPTAERLADRIGRGEHDTTETHDVLSELLTAAEERGYQRGLEERK